MALIATSAPGQSPGEQAETERLDFAVEGASCAGCMSKIERGMRALPGVASARFNLTTHRLSVDAETGEVGAAQVIQALDNLGYRARPYEPNALELSDAANEKGLLKAMAVAGFAAANIMLLSVSVWSGNATGMEPETRDLFHWVSALIAIPAVAYAGQPFFRSAFGALRAWRLNMDVPISLAVVLALIMSVVQTASSAEDAYFDSAVMLLFFLLIGRYLDMRSRLRTRSLGQNLLALKRPTVTKLTCCGKAKEVAANEIVAGDTILVEQGSRIGADGIVESGASTLDASLVTGESAPQAVGVGDRVYAGTLNLSGALTVRASAAGDDTLLDEIGALMDKATEKRGRYVRLADAAARIYAPVVHLIAALTFIGWLLLGAPWQPALLTAIAVLIITCPCALGLAVPVVQVVAAGTLFRRGILLNAGDALERLARADAVVFDKTGTLTLPEPMLANLNEIAPRDLEDAARLAQTSRHVLARTLSRYAGEAGPLPSAEETAGAGVSATTEAGLLRLGSAEYCGIETDACPDRPDSGLTQLWFRRGDAPPVLMEFAQTLKADAPDTIQALKGAGLEIHILSGDNERAVADAANALGVSSWRAKVSPKDKIAYIEGLQAQGKRVAMIGDGLNDAAALQSANVSIAPASAIDITQAAADIIIVGDRLRPIGTALYVCRRARTLILQNFALAGTYNVIAIPLAIAGYASPLVAALAMSGSSIVVTLNALRAQRLPTPLPEPKAGALDMAGSVR